MLLRLLPAVMITSIVAFVTSYQTPGAEPVPVAVGWAYAVGVSAATVDRELRMAKAWLRHELTTRGSAAVE